MESRQIGRDARTGHFISIRDAQASPNTSVVEIYDLPARVGRRRLVKRCSRPAATARS
jgi:hypothetical protein